MEKPEMKQFGRYEILSELGRGAMGVVYKARDPQIDRLVALKTVSLWGQEPDEEKEFRLRFMNEAQAAGRLHHSGIVSVFDVGENPENHDPYIVLEYVQGESLNRILSREKKLPLDRSLNLAEEIADALDYAHAQGVIHRDIKPANILITQDGHAKIADFGIAKLNLAHFTVPGRVLGTPAYMAPEQLSGESVDGRSDLFSLGVILYAMVTGHSPFQGTSATTVCFKVANREPIAASALDMINADKFTPVDKNLIPTGELRAVKGTPFDFTTSTKIGARIEDSYEQMVLGHGYDHNFVLNRKGAGLSLAARVYEPTTGRVLEVSTTQPAVQFYTGNFLDGSVTGKEGHVYKRRYGLCLETQHYPDSPNHPDFPSTILKPGEKFHQTTVFKFSAK